MSTDEMTLREMTLRLTIATATTFGSGQGVPGLIDRDVEHDANGFPYMRGRTLKGLLAESAEGLVFALALQGQDRWRAVKDALFGRPGRGMDEQGNLAVGDARLPAALRALLINERASYRPADVLESLTAVRRQTAMNPDGGPLRGTLRAMRVILPGVTLEAPLRFRRPPNDEELALLAAATLDWRRAGTGRNRGRGRLNAVINDEPTTRDLFASFTREIAS